MSVGATHYNPAAERIFDLGARFRTASDNESKKKKGRKSFHVVFFLSNGNRDATLSHSF